MRLKGKVAVITGAAGGIGQKIIQVFVAEGAHVLAADLNQADVDQVAAKYDGQVKGMGVDVTIFEQVQQMIHGAVENFGTLDIVINNAGISMPKMLMDDGLLSNFEKVTKVNQYGVLNGILAGAQKLIALKKPGVILNTSSIYGQMAAEMTFSYNVSKAAVDMMIKSAALELAPHKIRVVGVAPGRVDTPMLRELEEIGLWEHVRKEQMRDQFTQPEEIGNVFAFLASEDSNCINGSIVAAEDGYLNFKYPLKPNT